MPGVRARREADRRDRALRDGDLDEADHRTDVARVDHASSVADFVAIGAISSAWCWRGPSSSTFRSACCERPSNSGIPLNGEEASMMRLAVLFTALVAVATAVPPERRRRRHPARVHEQALQHKAKPMTFSNPGTPSTTPARAAAATASAPRANAGQRRSIHHRTAKRRRSSRFRSAKAAAAWRRPRRRPNRRKPVDTCVRADGSAEGFAKVFR